MHRDVPLDDLTPRQREVLRLFALGLTPKQIAQHLRISPKTVATHLAATERTIRLRGPSSLTRYAIRQGLVTATTGTSAVTIDPESLDPESLAWL